MSLINKYLNETALTSTKNRYLENELCTEIFKEKCSLKRTLRSENFSFQKCLTENRFLLHDLPSNEKDFVPERKKKKVKSDYYDVVKSKLSKMSILRSEPCKNLEFCSVESASLVSGMPNDELFVNLSGKPFGSVNTDQIFLEKSSESFGRFTFGSIHSNITLPGKAAFQSIQCDEIFPKATAQNAVFSSAPASEFSLDFSGNVPEKFISNMPTYNLKAINLFQETEYEFSSYSCDSNYDNFFINAKRKKMQLLNVISMALMFSSNLKNETDNYRIALQKAIDDVMLIEPEFILKVALYARQELQIRVVSNFLLSYAAAHQNTRIYLEKYFEASIVLPSDWIQVAEYYQILSCKQKKQSFPAALRRAMKKCFQKFDKYQLGKYNRVGSKKKQNTEKVSTDIMDTGNSSDKDNEIQHFAVNTTLTLKKLIRTLHIDSPSEHVMCLLEKKYPKNQTEFISSGLPGIWDPKKSGNRMKLPVPETWETRLSDFGNKPHIWESLIDNNKLPYMAMLRNLKNLILSGISSSHHQKVISNLQNKKYVINSRQLPMQYFEAYKILTKLQKMIEDDDSTSEKDMFFQKTDRWKKIRLKKMKEKIKNTSTSVVEKYKRAICKALEISSMNNLHPVPGKTLIICQIEQLNSSAKAKSYETCIMMGLMCLKACEDCKMGIFSSVKEMNAISLKEKDQFLDVLMKTCEEYKKLFSNENYQLRSILMRNEEYKKLFSDDSDFGEINNPVAEIDAMLMSYLKPQNMLSLKLDHLIFFQVSSGSMETVITSFLHKYRQLVNSDLLYTKVNFNLQNNSFSGECISEKDAYICGSSSSLIKFIAERSTGGQLCYVENIDVKYNLPEISESKYSHSIQSQTVESASGGTSNKHKSTPLNYRMPKWCTLRIFISSTFKDMMAERDLLIRYVFPELKRRAASIFVKIVEVDFRWGITEADSSSKKAAEICLREAQKADIFVGIIGERYGTIYNFEPPDAADLDWVKYCPKGLSITELEMHAAVLRKPVESCTKSFFYFRNNSFMKHVPKKWIRHFTAEDSDSKIKVECLKQKIKSGNFNIFDEYPCYWAGICHDKPILAGLDVLGNRILVDLWKAVQEIQKTEPCYDGISEFDMYQQNLIESKKYFIDQKSFSRESISNKIASKQGVFVIYGAAGCGKTTFLIHLVPCLKSFIVIKFFIGISPRSRDLSYIIQYLCQSTYHELGASVSLPSLPSDIVSYFPDFLLEVSNCCGAKEIIFLIDGLDCLEENDQRLDWLPLFFPNRIKVICSASQSSVAFKVLCEREKLGNAVSFLEMPLLLLPERELIVRNYLSYYRKILDESAFSNKMLKIVTKKDSSNPFYLQIVCDFLRIYGSFENLESILQNLPSSTDLFFQEIILQMENEFGSILIQTILLLLCITKEGLEDADLHYILSFVISINDQRAVPSFDELKKKIASLEPENLLSQVKYCSLVSTISTFVHGQMRQDSFSLAGTEFERAVKKFYRNRNLISLSKNMHCILAAYYHNVCDITNDGTYKVRSGFALRSLLYHMLNGSLYKELAALLCNIAFLKAIFLANADDNLLEYYSLLLYNILPSDQKLSREIDYSHLFSFHDFVSRNFHILHHYPDLLIQQAVNEPSSLVNLRKNQNKYYVLENLTRANIMDYRLITLCGFTKNITASAGKNLSNVIVLGTEDGYIKILDLTARRIVRTIKAHASEITYMCCIGRNQMCISSIDGTLSLWNTQDFSRISVLRGHRHNVTCCCSDPTGYILYSSGWDNSVRLWSAKDGRSITVIDDFRCPVNWIDHHPQKQQISCGLWNGNIEIWDTVSIRKKTIMTSLNGSVQSVAYTKDGTNIVSSYINSEICIWSSEEGLKMSCLKGHSLPVKTLTSLLNDNIVITGSDDCTLKVWSAVHRSHFTTIMDAKFCPINLMEFISENLIAVAFQNTEIWIFDINNGNAISKITLDLDIVSVFCKYSSTNTNLESLKNCFSEKYLAFGTQSGKLILLDILASSFSTALVLPSKITAAIHNCKIVVCGTSAGDIAIYHPSRKISKTIYSAHRGFIGSFCFSEHNETYLLSSANDNVLKLWSVESCDFELTLQNEFLNKHRDAITFTLFHSPLSTSSSLNSFLTGSYDNNVMLWDNDSVKVFEGLHSGILKIAYSSYYILGCGNDGALVMWHKNGAVLTTIPGINQSSAVLTFHITADSSGQFAVTLAYVDLDGSIKINKPLQLSYYCSLDGHKKPITSCCGTENKEIVSCSLDGSVNLWKVPFNVSEEHFMHESSVTGLILSSSLDCALSSDAHGNLILWKIDWKSSNSPLFYAGKKKYDQSFIKGLSWLKNKKFACAVSQVSESKERNFLDVIEFKESRQKTALCLEVTKSYIFDCEISCFDTCELTDGIVVGLKSGIVTYITPGGSKSYQMSDDWVLGLCFYSRLKFSDHLCISLVDGSIEMFPIQNLIAAVDYLPAPIQTHKVPDSQESSKFTSVMHCGGNEFICCGDSNGTLRIYTQSSLKFIKKVHDDLISGICVIDSYLFTSSLDKTIKGWNLKSFKQICQFYCNAPVSCLSSVQRNSKVIGQHSNILLIGTTSGNVHLLKFYSG